MKRVHGTPTIAKPPASGGPVSVPIDSTRLDEIAEVLENILAEAKITNMLLKGILQ